jgi:acetyl esterase/lipase
VRYLRAEAGHFKLNSDLIGAVGSSAGGHLVSLLALETAGDDWNVGQYAGESSQIQAVVDLFGPTDLDSPDLAKLLGPEIDTVFGAEPGSGSPLLTQSSPADIVRDGAPPFLIVQGTNDILVPKQQATELEERLRADHDSVDLLLVRGGQHGLTTPGESPDHVEIINEIVGFLESKLPSPLPPPPMPPVPNGSATK